MIIFFQFCQKNLDKKLNNLEFLNPNHVFLSRFVQGHCQGKKTIWPLTFIVQICFASDIGVSRDFFNTSQRLRLKN